MLNTTKAAGRDDVRERELRPAGPFARALALMIDELIRWTVIGALALAFGTHGTLSIRVLLMTMFVVYWSYGVIFDLFGGGQTPGKRMQRIRVVNIDGTPIRLVASLLRNLLLFVDMLPFAYMSGLITMMVSRSFRRIGDVAAGTLVVYVEPTREPWEVADFGCVLVRRWPLQLYVGWFATALPIFALCALLLRSDPGTAGFLLWWLKPVYERIPLWLLNRRSIGENPTLREAIAARRELATGLIAMLSYRRLSPTRSFDAPVDVLEGLRGVERRVRVQLMHRPGTAHAVWLTIIGAHIEALLIIGVVAMALLPIIRDANFDWQALLVAAAEGRFDWASNVVYFLAIAAVGPVYAAAGFALYRNRRDPLLEAS